MKEKLEKRRLLVLWNSIPSHVLGTVNGTNEVERPTEYVNLVTSQSGKRVIVGTKKRSKEKETLIKILRRNRIEKNYL